MNDREINEKIYGGYAVLALQNLGYSEKCIREFWNEFENIFESVSENSALEVINNFLDDNQKQVIFEGIEIPIEYTI